MGVLSSLEPKKVFYYFEELTKIPHGSGNVKKISDYLKKFAEDRNLKVVQDEAYNIIIEKPATTGYENEPAVIIQGHMDMVAVKTPDSAKDMINEGLDIVLEGDKIHAINTSLGGDDGIAVAYALALLDSNELKHPYVYVVITVDEEVGMDGARVIDLSGVKARRLINIDSEDEGTFLTSCAGGARFKSLHKASCGKEEGFLYGVKVSGLIGGHSGDAIIYERGNSNCIAARILNKLTDKMDVKLVAIDGGLADNAIPRETVATFISSKQLDLSKDEFANKLANDIKAELGTKDPNATIEFTNLSDKAITKEALSAEDTKRCLSYLYMMPNGVQAMSADVKGLVETSLNLGILHLEADGLKAEYSVRSSVESSKEALLDKLDAITTITGGEFEITGDYPGWKYRVDSPLRDKMVKVFEKVYGKTPKLTAIHAGLECGILAGKLDNLDCISFGPDMESIHTTEEKLSVASARRVWEYLVELLATKD